jgi:hypothetical protein
MFNRRFLYVTLTSILAILFHLNALAQSVDQSKTIKESDSLRKQSNKKEKLSLAPTDEDKASFAEFLKQRNTGLIRILPRGLYEGRIKIRGAGAYYSFARLTHEYGYGSDIELQMFPHIPSSDDASPPIPLYRFLTGFAGADYGFFVPLGDVPLEEVTLEHDGVKLLAGYRPPSAEPRARAEARLAVYGFKQGQYEYKYDAVVIVNCTYALRSIVYDSSDVLVAFRVVRQEIDGSVVILWKMLKRFSPPALAR